MLDISKIIDEDSLNALREAQKAFVKTEKIMGSIDLTAINNMLKERERIQIVLDNLIPKLPDFSYITENALRLSAIQKEALDSFKKNADIISGSYSDFIKRDLINTELILNNFFYDTEIDKEDEINDLIDSGYEEHIDYNVEIILGKIDKHLVVKYKGAIGAYHGDNPDKARHVLISLRELFVKLLNILAPTEDVKRWIDQMDNVPNGFLGDKGKVNRKAQIRYYYKDEDEFLVKFTENKFSLLESFINQTNSVHEELQEIDNFILERLIISAEYLIKDLLMDSSEKLKKE